MKPGTHKVKCVDYAIGYHHKTGDKQIELLLQNAEGDQISTYKPLEGAHVDYTRQALQLLGFEREKGMNSLKSKECLIDVVEKRLDNGGVALNVYFKAPGIQTPMDKRATPEDAKRAIAALFAPRKTREPGEDDLDF